MTKILPKGQVEVEIEDGFRIPYKTSELVVVSSEETRVFGEKHEGSEREGVISHTVVAEKGIYLAFMPVNDRLLDVYLINNTNLLLPFVLGEELQKMYTGIAGGELHGKTYQKVHQVNLDKFERWPAMIFQCLFFRTGTDTLREPIVRKLRFKADVFFRSKKDVPMLGKEGYLFQLDVLQLDNLDTEKMRTEILGGAPEKAALPQQPSYQMPSKPAKEVDLHAEALGISPEMMDNAITLQILHFERELEAAIANGMDEITFIHGVGSGKLKHELHRRLGKNSHVEFYREAKKEKFGYGATYVKLL